MGYLFIYVGHRKITLMFQYQSHKYAELQTEFQYISEMLQYQSPHCK